MANTLHRLLVLWNHIAFTWSVWDNYVSQTCSLSGVQSYGLLIKKIRNMQVNTALEAVVLRGSDDTSLFLTSIRLWVSLYWDFRTGRPLQPCMVQDALREHDLKKHG